MEWIYTGTSRDWTSGGYVIWCRCDGEFMVKWLECGLVGSAFTLKEAKKLAEEHKAKRDEEAELDRVGKFIVVGIGLPIHKTKRQAQDTAKRLGQRTEVLEVK